MEPQPRLKTNQFVQNLLNTMAGESKGNRANKRFTHAKKAENIERRAEKHKGMVTQKRREGTPTPAPLLEKL